MTDARPVLPRRVQRVAEARARFGDLTERLAPYLDRKDPLADEVVVSLSEHAAARRHELIDTALEGRFEGAPAALRELCRCAREVPPWVDWRRMQRAHEVFVRPGILGGLTLGLRSLVLGYAAPAGNKPLAFSGRLKERADRRLAETGRFVTAVTALDGLRPGALGFRLVLKVRLMHAEVRRLVLSSGRWSRDDWAEPINQHDMLATILLFSNVFIDGIRSLGVYVSRDEADDYQHLFRWVGELIGVCPELLPTTHAEASRLGDFILLTQGPPDDDSRQLVNALLDGPLRLANSPSERRRAERQVAVSRGLCRSLIGDELADALGLSRDSHRHWALGVRATLRLLESARRGVPRLNDWVTLVGTRYWEFTVNQGLAGVPARYELPEQLEGVPENPAR
ncbi:MAG TPA: oxygenase MpaB family protein [Polyangiaceae bacterium]|nr:oxygenase MpaB family protein [Polyangiaceae bacterium]